jgi:hypothetical protein
MVELADGTEAELRCLQPTMEGGNYGPYCEGSFEKQRYTCTLMVPLADSSGNVARRALPPLRRSTAPPLGNPQRAFLAVPCDKLPKPREAEHLALGRGPLPAHHCRRGSACASRHAIHPSQVQWV